MADILAPLLSTIVASQFTLQAQEQRKWPIQSSSSPDMLEFRGMLVTQELTNDFHYPAPAISFATVSQKQMNAMDLFAAIFHGIVTRIQPKQEVVLALRVEIDMPPAAQTPMRKKEAPRVETNNHVVGDQAPRVHAPTPRVKEIQETSGSNISTENTEGDGTNVYVPIVSQYDDNEEPHTCIAIPHGFLLRRPMPQV